MTSSPDPVVYLDTHVVVWLYAGDGARISPRAAEVIDAAASCRICPMVQLELAYLHEIGRITVPADAILGHLHAAIDLRLCDLPWSAVAALASTCTWTRDSFDRLITAHAMLAKAPLVTRDDHLRAHYPRAVW